MRLQIRETAALAGGLLLIAFELCAAAPDVWTERTDARSFPDRHVQRTLIEGPLHSIVGATDPSVGDSRDAYCLRIPDLGRFLATSDPALKRSAAAVFDVALFLFAADGRALLASEGPDPRRQTLAPTELAPEPPRPVAGRADEYILVVAGAGDAPLDASSRSLLAGGTARSFRRWTEAQSAGGAYSIGLSGAEGCGTLDVVLALDEPRMDRYCLGRAGAPSTFHCHGVSGDTIATSAVALGDLDNDGDLDAVFATTATEEANRICPGDGVGRFSFEDCSVVGLPGASSRGVALGDLDGAGTLDLVFANAGGEPMVCLGDGALGFSCLPVEAAPAQGRAVALGLLDGDGSLDAVFANAGQPSRACLGDGLGGFASCQDVNEAGEFQFDRDVALADVDGDGILDVVLATLRGGSICLGDGGASFACTSLGGAVSSGTAVAAGLLDDDLDIDLVFAQSAFGPRACLGNGSGSFACSPFGGGHPFGLPTGVALADLDNDGHLDAAISSKTEPSSLCIGDGSGSFSTCVPIHETAYRVHGLSVGPLAPASVGHDDFETGDLRAWARSVPDG